MVPCGPDGSTLQATYQHTDKPEFQDQVGEGIVRLASIIPDGMLVFMPSYKLCDKLCARWKVRGQGPIPQAPGEKRR